MSQKQLVLEKGCTGLHKIESYMFKQTNEIDSEKPITDIKDFIQGPGRQKYIDAIIGSLRSKYTFYVDKLMETNESIQENQYSVFQNRCSYGLAIHYVEFKFEHKTRGPIYIGLDLTTGKSLPLPAKSFYKSRGFEDADFFSSGVFSESVAGNAPTLVTSGLENKEKMQGDFKGSIVFFNNGEVPKDLKDTMGDTSKKLYNDGFKLMQRKKTGGRGGRQSVETIEEIKQFIIKYLTKLGKQENITESEFNADFNALSDKNEKTIKDFRNWFTMLQTYEIQPNVPQTNSFGKEYEIPDYNKNKKVEKVKQMFEFYTSGSYESYKGLLPLPIQDGDLYYTHHGTDHDMKAKGITLLCDFWKFMNENYTEASIDFEKEQEMRHSLIDLTDFRRKSWAMCRKIENKIEKLSDESEKTKQVIKLIDELDRLNRDIKGNARFEIKEKIAKMIQTFINSPSFYTNNYLNISLTGGAGTGKTTIAQVLARLFSALGLLATSEYTLHTRGTLVGQYIGQTAPKVRNALISALEGVFFLDEAYALAQSAEGFDPFGVEAINEFINFMDKNKGKISIITAGYHPDIEKYWFGPNEGMRRRMPYQWRLLNYSFYDLLSIFKGFYTKQSISLREKTPQGMQPPLPDQMKDIFTDDALQNLFGKLIRSCDLYYKTEKNPAPRSETNEKDLFNCYALLKNQAGDIENLIAKFNEKYISTKSIDSTFRLTSDDVDAIFSEIYFIYNPDKYILYSSYLTYPEDKINTMYAYFVRSTNCQNNDQTVEKLIKKFSDENNITPNSSYTLIRSNSVTPIPTYNQANNTDDYSSDNEISHINNRNNNNNNNNQQIMNALNSIKSTLKQNFAGIYNYKDQIPIINTNTTSSSVFGRLRRNYANRLIKQNKHLLKDERHRRQALQLYLMSLHNTNHL